MHELQASVRLLLNHLVGSGEKRHDKPIFICIKSHDWPLVRKIALGIPWTEPEAVTPVIVFLASDDA